MKVLLQYTDTINESTIELVEMKSADGVTFYRVNSKYPSCEVSAPYEEFNAAVMAYCDKLGKVVMQIIEQQS